MYSLALLPLLLAAASAQSFSAADYRSGKVMESILDAKERTWASYASKGYFNPGRWRRANGFSACRDGHLEVANITYRCSNLDVTGYMTHSEMGSVETNPARIGSSIWGWTIEGREFVAIGQSDGAALAEVVREGWWNRVPLVGKKAGTLDYLGRIPVPEGSVPAIWKEIKPYKDYALIGSEAVNHGIQIFDMRRLLSLRKNPLSTETKVWTEKDGSVIRYTDLPLGRSHNVLSSPSSETVIAVGAQPRNDTCLAGMIFIDVSDIENPKRIGCANEDGYVHDAQCLIYKGPDAKYYGREICYSYDENNIIIWDISDKKKPVAISNVTYPGAAYTHQGWVLDVENQDFILVDDELDEQRTQGPGADGYATTLIWNITSLENPVFTGQWKSKEKSTDHNQYVVKKAPGVIYSYQSNYNAGLRILSVGSVYEDPTGKGIEEVAFIDIFPDDDENPAPIFMGTWANTGGYFPSGHVAINTFDRGVFVVKRSEGAKGLF